MIEQLATLARSLVAWVQSLNSLAYLAVLAALATLGIVWWCEACRLHRLRLRMLMRQRLCEQKTKAASHDGQGAVP